MNKQKKEEAIGKVFDATRLALDRTGELMKYTWIGKVGGFFELLKQESIDTHPIFGAELSEEMEGVKKTGEDVMGNGNYSIDPRKWIEEDVCRLLIDLHDEGAFQNSEYKDCSLGGLVEIRYDLDKDYAKEWQSEKRDEISALGS
jgi:hypothetical protein